MSQKQEHPTRVIITLPVLLVGGTEVQTLHQVRVLAVAGYDVTICCFYENDEAMCAEMVAAGAEVVLLGAQRSEGLASLLRQLVQWFRQQDPDIVHVQYMAPGFIPVIAARLAGVRTVFATVHQPGRTYGWKAHLLLRTAARLCTAFFCNSLAVEHSWFGDATLFDPQRARSRRHWTIYNAVDVEKISSVVAATDCTALRVELALGDRPVIGCIGRLRSEKGQGVLIEAMTEVVRVFPDAVLMMVGDGPDRGKLENQSKSLGLTNNIRFLGQQSPEDVYRLLAIMNVVSVPSLFEGFGLVAAEAMAAARPVVASKVDGLLDVVTDEETGLLVDPSNPGALADAIMRLLRPNSKELQSMGKKGFEKAKDMFSMQCYSKAVLFAYTQVADKYRQKP